MAAEPSPSSPHLGYSRKRPLDNDYHEENTKKSNCSPGHDGIYHFKILVPSVAAGAIIGKGGETIAQIQKETNARIKMSKANDFYPGTSERVCLISGNTSSIMEVLDFITFKIREKPEVIGKEHETTKGNERDKQIKILVPNSTAGMIIGKGGNYIKKLKDDSGAYVQISQKPKDQSLQERCITVIGEAESNKKACSLILAKIEEDPQSGSCINVSYADMSGPVANFSPTGSPFAQPTPHNSSPSPAIPWSGLSESPGGLAGITLTLNLEPNSVPSQAILTHLVNAITVALNNTAYPEHIKTEINNSIATLAKYRMLGVSWAAPYVQRMDPGGSTNGLLSQPGRTALEFAFEPFRTPASPPLLNNNAFLIDTPDKAKESRKIEVEIPERLVGAVLGEGGRSLAGLQEATGALIQISKKGVFVPGTRNRLATISGSPPSILIAHSLIHQRLAEEESKRNRHHH